MCTGIDEPGSHAAIPRWVRATCVLRPAEVGPFADAPQPAWQFAGGTRHPISLGDMGPERQFATPPCRSRCLGLCGLGIRAADLTRLTLRRHLAEYRVEAPKPQLNALFNVLLICGQEI